MNPPLAIGIDLGGTNIRSAVVDGDGRILHRLEQPTAAARGPGPVIDDLADLVRTLLGFLDPTSPHQERGIGGRERSGGIVGIGLATPGPIDLHGGRIIHAANLPWWKDVWIRDLLREKTGLPVTLENDGNAAAYGEYRLGAGLGLEDLVMLTLGTGVGSGVIVNGRILHGHFDNAAELGHMIVVADGLPCPCGQRGCLEQYASADAVVRRVTEATKRPFVPQGKLRHEAIPARRDHAPPRSDGAKTDPSRERERADPPPLRAEEIAKRAADGDVVCEKVWDEACMYLAIACVTIQHAFNPAKIVLGGGLSNAGAQLLDRVNAHFRKHTWSLHNDAPEIVLARLGADAGLIGAAMLAMPPDT